MMFSFPTAPIMILMGGFVGSKLAFNPEFSTLPIALVVVGTVSGIIPATFLMKKIGRKKGFVGASFYSSMASFLASSLNLPVLTTTFLVSCAEASLLSIWSIAFLLLIPSCCFTWIL